jgi:hypothetical protein
MAGAFDYSQFKTLMGGLIEMEKEFDAWLRDFLTTEGLRALNLTRKVTPVDTGLLRRSWSLSAVERTGDSLTISLVNNTEYASFVEYGHYQEHRWVPGRWEGDKFIYVKGAVTGMALKDRYVPGAHMAQISLEKVRQAMPGRFDTAFRQWMAGFGWK